MTDKEYRTTRRRIIYFWEKWLLTLGFRHWSITADFLRDKDVSAEGWECLGKCSVGWEYMQAIVTFYVPGLLDKSDKDLEEIVVHEMVHILVNEMRQFAPETLSKEKMDEAMKHEERVVVMITNALLWTAKDAKEGMEKGWR